MSYHALKELLAKEGHGLSDDPFEAMSVLAQRILKLEGAVEEEAKKLKVGDRLYGFCGGFFGRDDYDDKVVTEIGPGYVVARPVAGGAPRTAHLDRAWTPDDLKEYTQPEPCYDCGQRHGDGYDCDSV